MGPPGPAAKGPLFSLFAKVAPTKSTPAGDAIPPKETGAAGNAGAGSSAKGVVDKGKGKEKRERSVELDSGGQNRSPVAGNDAVEAGRVAQVAEEGEMKVDAVATLAKPESARLATNLDVAIPPPQPLPDPSARPSKRSNQSTSLPDLPRPLSRSETKTSLNLNTASQTDSITLDDSDDEDEVEMMQRSSTGSTRSLRNSTATQSLRSARLALKSNGTTTKPTPSYALFNKPNAAKSTQEKKSKKVNEIVVEESTSKKKKAVPAPPAVVPYVPIAWSIGRFGASSTTSARKKEATTALEAAWPTREQHGSPRLVTSAATTLRESTDRWVSSIQSNGKGKGRAVEIEGEDYFNTLVQSFSTTYRDHSNPTVVTMTRAPQLVNHTRSSVPLLVPIHPPHPLLDRLSLPFKTTNPPPKIFRRPHDRGSLTEHEGGAKEGVMWTTKYAPLSAKEVLGEVSEKSAGILKQWLGEVAVMSAEEIARDAKKDSKKRRRKIVREATKVSRKKRSASTEFDDFLASDSDNDSDSNVLDTGYESNSSLSSSPYQPVSSRQNQSIFPNLTNLILLAGPKGTGKTCTAFAVAEEMGWDVFEVYPGMGRRGAKEIEGYVGEAGKNHTVWKAGQKGKGNPFAAAVKKALEVVEEGEGSKTRQSVILLEEIDVLYRDDKDFWPGVINLVKESKRPIIMTCNDYSLMPADDLPLQQIVYGKNTISFLPFAPPAPALAIPFLQLVALHEGHLIPPSSLAALYSHESAPTLNVDRKSQTEQIPFPDNGDGIPVIQGDVRRSLNQLQFECQWAVGDSMGGVGWMDFSDEGEKEEKTAWSAGAFARENVGVNREVAMELGGSLEDSVRATDSNSFCDAFVERRIETLLDDEPDIMAAEAEGEISNSVLTDLLRPERQQLPSHGIESTISASLLSLLPPHPLDKCEPHLYLAKRIATVALANRLILEADLLDLPAPQLPSPTIFSDYLPFIRAICQTDDLRAFADDQGVVSGFGGSKRSTRASGGRCVRRIEVRDERIYDEVGLSGFDLS